MTYKVPQLSLAGGEWAPDLGGRVDLPAYRAALSLCRNWIVRPTGGIVNRPGTLFRTAVKDEAAAVRLIPWVFSQGDSYVLEFGAGYIRFHTLGGMVLSAPATPLEVPSAYTAAQLAGLKYVQSADVMTLVHPEHPPRDLTRLGALSWTLTDKPLTPGILPPAPAPTLLQGVTAAATSIEFEYAVTALAASGEESAASASLTVNIKRDAPDRVDRAKIGWTAATGAVRYKVYGGRNGVLGLLGYTDGALFFFDDNIIPDYSHTPPSGDNPFDAAGLYPAAVAYFEQRLFFAGSLNEPQTIRGSQSSLFESFKRSTPPRSDDAIEFPLVSRSIDRILWIVDGTGALLVGTAQGVFRVAGDGGFLTGINPDQKPQHNMGAADLAPLPVQESILYATSPGSEVRDLKFTQETASYAGSSLSILAHHLLDRHTVVDWAYAQAPYSLVLLTRSDGVLLALTYQPEHDVYAWSQFVTEGAVESVCCVPEGTETGVYLVVRRTINGVTRRFVERFASRLASTPDGVFVDCALSYDGRADGTTTLSLALLSGGWLTDSALTVTASTAQFSAQDVGNELAFAYTVDDQTRELRVRITSYNTPTSVAATALANVPAELQATPRTAWKRCVRSVVGLDHLEGELVTIQGDGMRLTDQTVSAGAVTLSTPSAVVHVGLGYSARAESLRLKLGSGGNYMTGPVVVKAVSVELESARGIKVGEFGGRLQEAKSRGFEGYVAAPAEISGIVEVAIESRFNRGGKIVLQVDDPVPCEVLAFEPHLAGAR